MNILGINGLGIAPSACLLVDGKLVAFAEEERFSRVKGAFGEMPGKAAKFCLGYAGMQLEDISYIAFGWNAEFYRWRMPLFFARKYITRTSKQQASGNITRAAAELFKYHPGNIKRLINEMLRDAGIQGAVPPVKFVSHHLAHAASAFFTSGFEDAHILVIDGSGEADCTTIMRGFGKQITLLERWQMPDSLGWFYQSITEYLGFTPNNHEGKVMALASYGVREEAIHNQIKKMIAYDKNGYRYDAGYSFSGAHHSGSVYSDAMVKLLGPPRAPGEPITDTHKNIACSAQLILEEVAAHLVEKSAALPGFSGNVCLAGGVALNCKMNGVVARLNSVKNIVVPPVANDAGTALGAAVYLSASNGEDPRFRMEHAYWGPEFSKEQIRKILIHFKVRFSEESEIERTTAQLLAQDKVIGWFQGRMEAGPRALGARSILANPSSASMKDIVNEKVKDRENWRPFAASVLFEKKDQYIIDAKSSPFMTLAFKVTEHAANHIPAAIHIDKTIRPQFVKKEVHPVFWNLINEFGRITGVYAILNTSFNLNEEPIVCTPEQALRAFYTSGMDYLSLGNFIVSK